MFCAALTRISSSSLAWMAAPSRFCVFWIRKTIRNVTIVVPVLITSCQVSEKLKNGPLAAQRRTTSTQAANVQGLPVARATQDAKSVKKLEENILGSTPA